MNTTTTTPNVQYSTPRENRWLIPEGDCRAVFKSIRPAGYEKVRLTFDVLVPGSSCMHYAAKNYSTDLSGNSPLRLDLLLWRGHDITSEEWTNGSVDFDPLIGQPVDLHLEHICNHDYPEPFVFIKGIYPAGSRIRFDGN